MPPENWRDYAKSYKPITDTERKQIPLEKYPKSLDFSKTVGNTTYVVNSKFNNTANDSLLDIVLRWIKLDTDISV